MIVCLTAFHGIPRDDETLHFIRNGGVCIGQCTGLDDRFYLWVAHTFNGGRVSEEGATVRIDDADGCSYFLKCRNY